MRAYPGPMRLRPKRLAVTSATALPSAGDRHVAIEASFNGALTLPPATRAGQLFIIADEAGVGSGDANGASENLIHVEVDDPGSETIVAPGVAAARSRLLLWKRGGVLALVSSGVGSWHAVTRSYWHIDPRTVSGMECWFDTRRGITLNGDNVSAHADLSGNNIDAVQATAGAQPQYVQPGFGDSQRISGENLIRFQDTGRSLASSATVAVTSGAATLIVAYIYDFARAAGTERIFQTAVTGSLGIFYSLRSSAPIGGAPSGYSCITGNNTATTSYQSAPGCFAAMQAGFLLGGQVRVDTHRLAASPNRANKYNGMSVIAGTPGVSASGAVSSFTQTIQIGNSIVGASLQTMLFDAAVSFDDIVDIENAISETYGIARF